MKWPTKSTCISRARMLADPSETGLVGAWGMRPSGIIVPDKSPYGNDGTIVGPTHENSLLGDVMRFDGADDVINIGNTGRTVKTAAFWVKPATTTEDFIDFDGGTHSIEVTAGTVTATGFVAPVVLINGEASTVLSANLWSFIVVITDTGFTASNMVIGNETIYLEGRMGPVRIYSDAKTSAWSTSEYAKSKNALWRSDWGAHVSVAARGVGDFLENTPARIVSGTHRMVMDTIDGEDSKVIECVTAGSIAIPTTAFHQTPTEAAYGEWEFWFNKAAASDTDCIFIAEVAANSVDVGQNGYLLRINNAERIRIEEITAGVESTKFFTNINQITIGTWYKTRITRTDAGITTVYLDDAIVGNLGGGSNPFTDTTFTVSNYLVFDLDIGDKIAWSDISGDHSLIKRLLS